MEKDNIFSGEIWKNYLNDDLSNDFLPFNYKFYEEKYVNVLPSDFKFNEDNFTDVLPPFNYKFNEDDLFDDLSFDKYCIFKKQLSKESFFNSMYLDGICKVEDCESGESENDPIEKKDNHLISLKSPSEKLIEKINNIEGLVYDKVHSDIIRNPRSSGFMANLKISEKYLIGNILSIMNRNGSPMCLEEIKDKIKDNFTNLRKSNGSRYHSNMDKVINSTLISNKVFTKQEDKWYFKEKEAYEYTMQIAQKELLEDNAGNSQGIINIISQKERKFSQINHYQDDNQLCPTLTEKTKDNSNSDAESNFSIKSSFKTSIKSIKTNNLSVKCGLSNFSKDISMNEPESTIFDDCTPINSGLCFNKEMTNLSSANIKKVKFIVKKKEEHSKSPDTKKQLKDEMKNKKKKK